MHAHGDIDVGCCVLASTAESPVRGMHLSAAPIFVIEMC